MIISRRVAWRRARVSSWCWRTASSAVREWGPGWGGCGGLGEDGLDGGAEGGAGFGAEVGEQAAADAVVDADGVGLAVAAVEREHELVVEAFAERVGGGGFFELTDDLAVAVGAEGRVVEGFQGGEAVFFQDGGFGAADVAVGAAVEGGAAPEGECGAEQGWRGRG